MKSVIKSELRKLLTVRSTYVLAGIILLLVVLFAFYIQGFKLSAVEYSRPNLLSDAVWGAVPIVSIFSTIAVVLLMTHEYRYNTIMYTLLNANKRIKILAAKILVASAFALLITAAIDILSPLLTYLGVKAAGHTPGHQDIHALDLAWRSLFYGWGYAMFGLIIAAIARSQVAAIAAIFVIPGAVEQLLGLLLKSHYVYLPFSALGQVISTGGTLYGARMAPARAAIVVVVYLVILWLLSGYLFKKRDAN